MNPFSLGSLLGALIVLDLISRIVSYYFLKKATPARKKDFLVSLLAFAICTLLGRLSFGVLGALLLYGIGTLPWLAFELIRAIRKNDLLLSQKSLKKQDVAKQLSMDKGFGDRDSTHLLIFMRMRRSPSNLLC
ncbi:MAG: hypothetical protein AAF704_08455 [Cyanobacteria bacterium P01_D01_bin.123]